MTAPAMCCECGLIQCRPGQAVCVECDPSIESSGDWDMHALDAGYEEFPHDE